MVAAFIRVDLFMLVGPGILGPGNGVDTPPIKDLPVPIRQGASYGRRQSAASQRPGPPCPWRKAVRIGPHPYDSNAACRRRVHRDGVRRWASVMAASAHAERAARNGPNEKLRQARLHTLSPSGSGLPMRRQEVADACNEIMHRLQVERGGHRRRAEMTARSVGALERGEIRWPGADCREALRLLFDRCDSDLGFFVSISARSNGTVQTELIDEVTGPQVVGPDVFGLL